MPERLKRFLKTLQFFSDRWWYVPLMAFLILLDLFVVVIPSEGILVKTVLLKPKRWWYVPGFFVLSSALGAALLAYLTQEYGQDFLMALNPDLLQNPGWESTERFIHERGALAMALISLGPFPQQPAVALCGLAEMKLSTLFLAVCIGRAPKYYLFGWLATHAPRYLARLFPGHTQDARDLNSDGR